LWKVIQRKFFSKRAVVLSDTALFVAFQRHLHYIEPMNTDEPTKDLKDPQEYETKPILAAILERVNAIADELAAFRQETNTRLDALESEMRDVKKNLRSLERRFDIFNQDLNRIRGDMLDHENRIEDLERKAS
jgi:flagellar motility protein MotE (MotC chaperone)